MANIPVFTTEHFRKEVNVCLALKIEVDFDSGIVSKGHYIDVRMKAQKQENLMVWHIEMFIIFFVIEINGYPAICFPFYL